MSGPLTRSQSMNDLSTLHNQQDTQPRQLPNPQQGQLKGRSRSHSISPLVSPSTLTAALTPSPSKPPKSDGNATNFTYLTYQDLQTKQITIYKISLLEKNGSGNDIECALGNNQWRVIAANLEKIMRTRTEFSQVVQSGSSFTLEEDSKNELSLTTKPSISDTSGASIAASQPISLAGTQQEAKQFFSQIADCKPEHWASHRARLDAKSFSEQVPEWGKDTSELSQKQIDEALHLPAIGIKNGGSTCFLNTMLQSGILADRELVIALLNHRKKVSTTDQYPTKIIEDFLFNYIHYRLAHKNDLSALPHINLLRNALVEIAKAQNIRSPDPEGYRMGQHDAMIPYMMIREFCISQGILSVANIKITMDSHWEKPNPADTFEESEYIIAPQKTDKTSKPSTSPEQFFGGLRLNSDGTACDKVPIKEDLTNGCFLMPLTDPNQATTKTSSSLSELINLGLRPTNPSQRHVKRPNIKNPELVVCNPSPASTKIFSGAPARMIFEYTRAFDSTTQVLQNPIEIKHPTLTHLIIPKKHFSPTGDDKGYTLKSIMVHTGETGGGHWYQFVLQSDRKWMRIDDNNTRMIEVPQIINELIQHCDFKLFYDLDKASNP